MDDPPVQPHVTARQPRPQFDSSRTRVGPVFGALAATVGDEQWVRRLLDLTAGPGEHPWRDQDLSVIERYHHAPPGADTPKEKGLAPPVTLLAWLLDHFTKPKNGKYGLDALGDLRRPITARRHVHGHACQHHQARVHDPRSHWWRKVWTRAWRASSTADLAGNQAGSSPVRSRR